MKVAARAHVPPFAVMEIIAAANARRARGQHVLNLAAGEPAAGASRVVRQRAIDLLDAGGGLGYTESLGIPALRAAIAAHYRDWYERHARSAQRRSHDGLLRRLHLGVPCRVRRRRPGCARPPGYPAYRNILTALGCEVVELACGPQTRFQPTVEMLAAAHAQDPLDGIVLASPANPTGTMLDAGSAGRHRPLVR